MPFFSRFPKVGWDVNRDGKNSRTVVTDVLFRVALLPSAYNNHALYGRYEIKDEETPEVLAEKLYGDAELHWLIIIANKIVDPQWDWPLSYEAFNRYVADKYGSVETAQTTNAYYQRVVHRRDLSTGTDSYSYLNIDSTSPNANIANTIPYDTYDTLPVSEPAGVIYTLPNGSQAREATYRQAVTAYDHEFALNEAKRQIQIVSPAYAPQVVEEFRRLTEDFDRSQSFIRTAN